MNIKEIRSDFLNKVIKTSHCWIWMGGRDGFYGTMKNPMSGYKTISAHRMSYTIFHGKIPDGKMICHKCDNPPCVNPDHIYAGTHKDNSRDLQERYNSDVKGDCCKESVLGLLPFKERRKLLRYYHMENKRKFNTVSKFFIKYHKIRGYYDFFETKL